MNWQVQTFVYGRCVPGTSWSLTGRRINRIYYIHSGTAYIVLPDGRARQLLPGRVYVLPETMDISVSTLEEDPVDHTYFNFDCLPCFSFREEVSLEAAQYPMIQKTLEFLQELIAEYRDCYLSAEVLSVVNSTLQNLLWLISQVCELPVMEDFRIAQVLRFIQENLEQELTIEKLACGLYLDKHYFIRLFYKNTGQTPHNYIRNKRLNHAAFLLQKGIAVKEVAQRCGYDSASAFSRSFKSYYGCAPSDYPWLPG